MNFSDIPSEEELQKLKVADLKNICTTNNLATTGLKAALVQRLLDFAQEMQKASEEKRASQLRVAEEKKAAAEAKRRAIELKKKAIDAKKQAKQQAKAEAAARKSQSQEAKQSDEVKGNEAVTLNDNSMQVESKSAEIESTPISDFFVANFPFFRYFDTSLSTGKPLFTGKSWEEDMLTAETCYLALKEKFTELEECRPFELLRNGVFNCCCNSFNSILLIFCRH